MKPEDETILFKAQGEDETVPPRPVRILDLIDPREKRADGQTRSNRMLICKDCEKFENGHRCSECGCFMILKTWLDSATCPLGKW